MNERLSIETSINSYLQDNLEITDIEIDTNEDNREINILVIEDDPHDFDFLRRKLNQMGIFNVKVFHATDVIAAREIVENNLVDIALVDYFLGNDSGIRAIQEIGGRVGEFPIVMISGMPGDHVQNIGMNAGAINHLNKENITTIALETTIRSAIYTHRLETKLKNTISELKKNSDTNSTFFAQVNYVLNNQIKMLNLQIETVNKEQKKMNSMPELKIEMQKLTKMSKNLMDTFEELTSAEAP